MVITQSVPTSSIRSIMIYSHVCHAYRSKLELGFEILTTTEDHLAGCWSRGRIRHAINAPAPQRWKTYQREAPAMSMEFERWRGSKGEMPDLHLAVIVLHLNRGTNFVCGDRILAPQIHSSAQHNASSAISINDFAWMPSYRFGRDDGASMKTTDPVVSNGST
jgi:hypothetical protein